MSCESLQRLNTIRSDHKPEKTRDLLVSWLLPRTSRLAFLITMDAAPSRLAEICFFEATLDHLSERAIAHLGLLNGPLQRRWRSETFLLVEHALDDASSVFFGLF